MVIVSSPPAACAISSRSGARFAVGVNFATEPAGTKVTTPVTAAPPGPDNVKVVVSMVAGFIATLKVAERA